MLRETSDEWQITAVDGWLGGDAQAPRSGPAKGKRRGPQEASTAIKHNTKPRTLSTRHSS